MVAYRVRLVFHGIEFLPVWHVRLVGHDGRGVWQQGAQWHMLCVGSSLEVLCAAGAVFYVVHWRVSMPSGR